MIEIKDVLNLLGNELKDETEQSKRFREFAEQEKWSTEQIEKWLGECIESSSGAHDPHNRAFQDLIVSLGNRLGFEAEYGRYAGKAGEDNYDGDYDGYWDGYDSGYDDGWDDGPHRLTWPIGVEGSQDPNGQVKRTIKALGHVIRANFGRRIG